MADKATKIKITAPQEIWLGAICSKLRNGEPVSARGLKVALRGKLPGDFHPSEIDSRLLRHEDKITILGIGLLDPESEAVIKADTVILSIRELLESNHEIKSVGVDYVSEDTKLPQVEVACVFKDLSEIGVFHDSGTNYGYGIDGWATINIDDKAFDGFLKYESIERILDSIVEGRGEVKRPPADDDSQESAGWDFFIAHAGKDKLPAQELYRLLVPHSRVFLDSECLLPGDDWDRELPTAQRTSRITLVLVSSNVEAAYYAREEIASAIAMAREDQRRHRVVPIYLDSAGAEILYGLRIKHGLSVTPESGLKTIAEQLLQLLARLTGTPDRCAERPGADVEIKVSPTINATAGEPLGHASSPEISRPAVSELSNKKARVDTETGSKVRSPAHEPASNLDYEPDETARRILVFLAEPQHQTVYAVEIGNSLGLPQALVKFYLDKLAKEDFVLITRDSRTNSDVCTITTKGKKFLDRPVHTVPPLSGGGILAAESEMQQTNMPLTAEMLHEFRSNEFKQHQSYVHNQLAKGYKPEETGFCNLPEDAAVHARHVSHYFDNLGLYVKRGVVDKEIVISFMGDTIVSTWEILEPFIRRERELREERKKQAPYQKHFEDLADLARTQQQ